MKQSPARPVLLALLALPASLPPAATAQDRVFPSALHDYRVVTVAEGLVNPWAMAFLPGGDMLVTERAGRLRLVRNGVVVEQGPADEIFENPKTDYTKALLAAAFDLKAAAGGAVSQ